MLRRHFCKIDLLDSVQRSLALLSLRNTCSFVCSDDEVICLLFFPFLAIFFFDFVITHFPNGIEFLCCIHMNPTTLGSRMGSLYNEHPQIKYLLLQLLHHAIARGCASKSQESLGRFSVLTRAVCINLTSCHNL